MQECKRNAARMQQECSKNATRIQQQCTSKNCSEPQCDNATMQRCKDPTSQQQFNNNSRNMSQGWPTVAGSRHLYKAVATWFLIDSLLQCRRWLSRWRGATANRLHLGWMVCMRCANQLARRSDSFVELWLVDVISLWRFNLTDGSGNIARCINRPNCYRESVTF